MSISFGQSVTHHVAGTPTTDAYGDEVAVFTDHVDQGATVFPGNSVESFQNRTDIATSDRVLVFQPAHPVSAVDEFTLPDGFRYGVLGGSSDYHSSFTGAEVTEVRLRRIA